MKEQYYTYLYTDPEKSQHLYVGKGKGNRAYQHLSNCKNKALGGRLTMMAAKAVAPIIRLYPQDTEQGALELEIFLISLIGRKDLGKGRLFNHTDGGDGASGAIRSKETRANMSAAKNGKTFSDSHKAKLSAAKNGKTFSDSHKAKLSAAKQNTSDETRAKLSAAKKGKPRSEETRANISAAQKGKKLTEEHRAALKAAWVIRKNNKKGKQ